MYWRGFHDVCIFLRLKNDEINVSDTNPTEKKVDEEVQPRASSGHLIP
jgi:hypothetical protein